MNRLVFLQPTNSDLKIIVDEEDADWLSKFGWNIDFSGYASHSFYVGNRICKQFRMHSLLMTNTKFVGLCVDHINRNKLDNRKENLRLVSPSINSINREKNSYNTSGYIGVSFQKTKNNYRAYVAKDKKRFCLGNYNTPEEAAIARDKKAVELYGDLAVLNFGDKK